MQVKKVDPVTLNEVVDNVNAEDLALQLRPFVHPITVAWNGETVIALPADIQALLPTSSSRAKTYVYILAQGEVTEATFRSGAAYEFVEASGSLYFKWNLSTSLKTTDNIELRRG